MTDIYNFSAGPAMLPREVMFKAQAEFLDWRDGLSALEISHRSARFMTEIIEPSNAALRELMRIPDNYKILFLPGGATAQFSMVPLNLLANRSKKIANYFLTGHWSQKAINEAKRYCEVKLVTSSEEHNFTTINSPETWQLCAYAAYVHYTPNETIHGLEFVDIPEVGNLNLVADMSSCILSREFKVDKFGIIYAGAQKNLGPSGITVVIIRDDLIGQTLECTPSMYDYKIHADAGSCYNTPPTYNWYLVNLVLQWVKDKGGVAELEKINIRKSKLLYDYIDNSEGFYINKVDFKYRSRMNVVFELANKNLEPLFLQESAKSGLMYLKGHSARGGLRASIYNAMPEQGVRNLIAFMKEFTRSYG